MSLKFLPPLVLTTLFCAVASAADESPNSPSSEPQTPAIAGESFYREKEKGWFWYEEPAPEPKPKPKPKPAVPPEPKEKTPPADSVASAPSGPPPGSVAWIKSVLPKLREAAIDDPSDENIQAYYFTQRLMMDKSETFSRRSMDVIKNNPLLDEDLRYPASNAASDALATAAGKQKEQLLKAISEQAALVLFYRGENCTLCDQAVAALTGLQHRYGFTVMTISMDGSPLPNSPFGPHRMDNGLADQLGVFMTPAIGLAMPPSNTTIISYSTISMETATSRILSAARDEGIISKEEYQATSRIASIGLIDGKDLEQSTPNPLESPEQYVERMQQAAKDAFLDKNGDDQ